MKKKTKAKQKKIKKDKCYLTTAGSDVMCQAEWTLTIETANKLQLFPIIEFCSKASAPYEISYGFGSNTGNRRYALTISMSYFETLLDVVKIAREHCEHDMDSKIKVKNVEQW